MKKESYSFGKRRFRAFGSVLLVLIFTFGSVVAILAQETTGTIEGTVSDTSGGRVSGATVKVENPTFSRIVTTGDDGYFRVREIPPGVYKVTVNSANFSAWTVENVTVIIGKAVQIEAQLKPKGAAETVTITGSEVVQLDPTDSKVQTNISRTLIDKLPGGTNFTSLLKLSPATRPEPLSGQFQVDGASGSENNFIIDGQEVSNFRTGVINQNNNLPFEFIQEMQIKTSGFEAEFGGATGGVINVVTKSGTNAWHGQGSVQFENNKLQGDPRPFLNAFRSGTGSAFIQINEYLTPKKDDFTNVYPSGTLSGPIIKDRAWFLASYAPQFFKTTRESNYFSADPRTRVQTASEIYRFRQRNEYAFSRLDVAATSKLRLTSTFTWNPIIQIGALPAGNISIGGAIPSVNFGADTGVLTGHRLTDRQGGRQNANNVTAAAVWTPTNKLVGTFRFTRGFLNEKLGSYLIPNQTRFVCSTSGLNPPAAAGCALGFTNFPSNAQNNFDISIQTAYEGDVSYLTSFGGRHEFKGGYRHSVIHNDVSNNNYIPTGIVNLLYGVTITDLSGANLAPLPGSIGSGYIQRFGRQGSASNTAQSIYVQDKWQPINRLSINAGVRLEKEDLPSFNGFAPPINFGFGDKVVPRLGAAFDLKGDGRTKLFASFGQFTDRLKFELPRGSFGGEFYRRDYFDILGSHPEYTYYTRDRILGTNADVLRGQCPIVNSTGLTRCQFDFRIASNDPNATIFEGKVDPNLHPYRETAFDVGVEHQIKTNYLFRGRYTHKYLNWAIEDAGFPTVQGSEAYIIGNPGSGLHAQLAQQFGYAKVAHPQRVYDAMELVLDRRLANHYYFNLAYTYSRLYGNYSGLASSDENGRTSPGVNRFFDLPFIGFTTTGAPDNGRLATDRPHVFNAFGGYDFNWFGNSKNTTEFSVFTTAQSGTPLTTFITFYSAAFIYQGRGDLGRTDSFTQTDFAVAHRVRLSESKRVTFDVIITNLFDQANVTTVFNTISPTNFGSNLNLGNEPTTINKLLTDGVKTQIDAILNDATRPDRKYTHRGFANGFQGPRQIRLGVKFDF